MEKTSIMTQYEATPPPSDAVFLPHLIIQISRPLKYTSWQNWNPRTLPEFVTVTYSKIPRYPLATIPPPHSYGALYIPNISYFLPLQHHNIPVTKFVDSKHKDLEPEEYEQTSPVHLPNAEQSASTSIHVPTNRIHNTPESALITWYCLNRSDDYTEPSAALLIDSKVIFWTHATKIYEIWSRKYFWEMFLSYASQCFHDIVTLTCYYQHANIF